MEKNKKNKIEDDITVFGKRDNTEHRNTILKIDSMKIGRLKLKKNESTWMCVAVYKMQPKIIMIIFELYSV